MTAPTFYDRVKVGVTGTPGTGVVTLGSAKTGFQTFAGAGVADGATVSYVIEDGSNWEIGRGVYASSGTTLTRTTVLAGSSGTSHITASPAAVVYVTALAEDLAAMADTPFYRASDLVKPSSALFTNGLEMTTSLGATVTDTTRGMFLKVPSPLPTLKQVILTKALPSTPYTVKVLAMPLGNFADYSAWGIVHADGANKNIMYDMSGNNTNGTRFDIQQNDSLGAYNNDAAYSNNVVNKNMISPTWLKLQDDGTNIAFAWSADGEFWHFLHGQSRTAFLTPTKLGLTVFLGTPTDTAGDLGIHVLSYSETAGLV